MGRDHLRNDERNRIAQLAARIMVEDGVEDYASAKRKAARQAGVADTRQLPTNEEVDAELRTHRSLFSGDAHGERLRSLREQAVKVMRELDKFNPYLTGSVLSGNAGRYADINLQLYAESAKAVELYLIDADIRYKTGQCRLYCGRGWKTVPTFTLDDEDVQIELVVLSTDDLRQQVRTRPEGKPVERARLQAVEAMLEIT